jgi:hypothetical protein
MAFVLAYCEPVTFLAQLSFLGLLSIFESIVELSLGVLPMGQSMLSVLSSTYIAQPTFDIVRLYILDFLAHLYFFINEPLS